MCRNKKIFLIIIAILNIVFAFKLFIEDEIIIIVNSKNKEIITEVLKYDISDTDNIAMLKMVNYSGYITIYHSLGKVETIGTNSIESYIRENGFYLYYIAFFLIVVDIIILIYLKIYRYVKKKNEGIFNKLI